jgi:hypothetical protein
MFRILKFIIKVCLVFTIALVAFRYFSAGSEEFGSKEIGEGIGNGLKKITKVPGKIKDSETYQKITQGIKKGYKDTIQ